MDTRNYELMFIVSPELGDEELDAVLQRVQRYLDASEVQIVSKKSWGLRKLAYTLAGQREGRYYLVLFRAMPSAINELDRNLRLIDGVLRHLIVRMETEMPEPEPEPEPEPPAAEPTPLAPDEAEPEPEPEDGDEGDGDSDGDEAAGPEESGTADDGEQ